MVRPDLTVDDVFLGPLMIRGSVEGADAGHSTTASRALGLLLDGMAARDRDTR